MSEEEIIEKVKDEIREYSEISNMFSEFPNKTKEDCDKCVEALQGLLDLYTHKKGRVEELKQELLEEKEKNNKALEYIETLEINSIGTTFKYTEIGNEIWKRLKGE